jgi:hypothetical protein
MIITDKGPTLKGAPSLASGLTCIYKPRVERIARGSTLAYFASWSVRMKKMFDF